MDSAIHAPARATSKTPLPPQAKALLRKFIDLSDEGELGAEALQQLSAAERELLSALDAVLRSPENFDVSQRTRDALQRLGLIAGAPAKDAPPAPPLPALYELIFVGLQQLIALDEIEGASMSLRLTRMAADRFREFRQAEASQPVAVALNVLYDVQALVQGAYDIEDVSSMRMQMLEPLRDTLEQVTDRLASSPDWNADDLLTKPGVTTRTAAERRAGWVLGRIMSHAKVVGSLCAEVIDSTSSGQDHLESAALAAHALADQIGLLAEIGQQDVGSEIPGEDPDARAWLLPPEYHAIHDSGVQQ